MISERVAKLRQQSLEAKPCISTERAELMTEAYTQTTALMSAPMRRALAFKHLMEHKTVVINPGELIVGEKGPAPKATPTYPELCCHSLADLDLLNSREKIPFSVSAEARQTYQDRIIPFWKGRSMRDLLFAESETRLDTLMLRDPFFLKPQLPLNEAMKLVLDRHYPAYPVCDDNDVLIGLVRGQAMFEEQAIEITAQVGSMVGVEKEERLATPWGQSFKFRHPWLQLNLLTAFAAGAVVGIFQDTVDRLVILALFLPVLAGQSGNTGCQALAVTLRGITLGDLKKGGERALVFKEATLGFANGAFTGIVAALGMFLVATHQKNPNALMLAGVVWLALVASCVASGVCGAMVPLTLKRFGADPATASSIFLTTATDVVSMGLLLGLATVLI